MKRTLALVSVMLLGVAAAQNNQVNPINEVYLTDVPADHWARAAVELLVERGVMSGYPDGTFRGEYPVTRYELASTLVAALDSGAIMNSTNLSDEDLIVVQRGVSSVAGEIQIIREQMGLLASSVTSHDEALREQARVLSELQGIRAGDEARMTQLEAELAVMRAYVASLEQERVKEATNALNTPHDGGLGATFVEDPQTLDDAAFVKDAEGNTPIGGAKSRVGITAGAEYVAGRVSPVAGLNYDVSPQVGVEAYGGLLTGDIPGFLAGANLNYYFSELNDVRPYALLGGGVLSSESEEGEAGTSEIDFFTRAGAGAEYSLSSTLGLRAEVYGNYLTSGKGLAANEGMGVGAKLGVKLRF